MNIHKKYDSKLFVFLCNSINVVLVKGLTGACILNSAGLIDCGHDIIMCWL